MVGGSLDRAFGFGEGFFLQRKSFQPKRSRFADSTATTRRRFVQNKQKKPEGRGFKARLFLQEKSCTSKEIIQKDLT